MTTARNSERIRFRYGMCLNDNCSKCKSKEIQEIPARKDLVCTECGKPLRECPPPKKSSHLGLILGIAIIIVVVLAIGAYFLFRSAPESKNITISLNHDEVSISVGEHDTLKVEVSPVGIDCNCEWESSDTSVISVKAGIVTAIQKGVAKVSVKAETGDLSAVASCDYIVNENDTLKAKSDSILSVCTKDSINNSSGDVKQDSKFPTTTSNNSISSSEKSATSSSKKTESTVSLTTLACGKYEGPMSNGEPNGIGGTIYITKSYTISLKDGTGGVVEVSLGDKIVDTKFKNGILQQGQLIRANGERKYLSGLAEQLK